MERKHAGVEEQEKRVDFSREFVQRQQIQSRDEISAGLKLGPAGVKALCLPRGLTGSQSTN